MWHRVPIITTRKGNWRWVAVANHVGGDWMCDKLLFGEDDMIGGKERHALDNYDSFEPGVEYISSSHA